MEKDILQSKLFKNIVFGVTGFLILVLVFSLGVFVGTERASFAFQWADEYHRNFGGPQGGIFGDFAAQDREFTNSNGTFGQIIKIGDNNLTVKDRDNTEKIILIDAKTSIVFQKKNIKITDLTTDENVVVIGEPNSSGQILAKLVRVMPPLPTSPAQNKNTIKN